MRLLLIAYSLALSVLSVTASLPLALRQVATPDNTDPETFQCLAPCLQGVAASHRVEFEKCTEQTMYVQSDAQQACVCKSEYFKENLKCIAKCYKADVVDDALDAQAAACARFANGDGITSGSGSGSGSGSSDNATDTGSKDNSKGAGSGLRASSGALAAIAIASLVVFL
ncbi:hypothetical protein AURDEDRAFT_129753 [Auricularia subglabra TFB-10046 SS5]|uniref:Extracellular membrane protein CFEM domain-containing protein n=1 Tax=Auricularia subglabra (strain TFB-10046 / SS5) TaxID=717982 RepID=J0DAA0_AURST|nr:hypothetical protein AURDEDRAFT_129753 [Auricularia subglabra TFB-10046 SS5]